VWLQELKGGVSEARDSKMGEVLRYSPYSSCSIRVITFASTVVTPRERKEIILSSQPVSSMPENDLQFEWLLCLAGILQACGSGRVIPLNSVAYAALVRWSGRFQAKPEDYVFPACEDARIDCPKPNVGKIDASRPFKSWRTAWRRALKDAGLDIRFHDLWHTCITKLAEGQASEQTLMAIAGHLSRKMLEHYSHARMVAKRAAVDAIAKPVFDSGVAQNWAQSPSLEKTAAPN
jgi:hypothetical protein